MSLANDTYPWAPAEGESAIVAQRAWLQGDMLSAVAYGAEPVLRLLHDQLSLARSTLSFLALLCVVFIFGSLFIASIADLAQLSFIHDCNLPGDPDAFESNMNTNRVGLMGHVV